MQNKTKVRISIAVIFGAALIGTFFYFQGSSEKSKKDKPSLAQNNEEQKVAQDNNTHQGETSDVSETTDDSLSPASSTEELQQADGINRDEAGNNSANNQPDKASKDNAGAETSATSNDSETLNTTKLSIINRLVSWGFQASSGRKIDTIIVHSSYDAIGDNPYDVSGVIAEYKSYGVSPHYLIDRKGVVYRLVADQNIAYHAGESQMPDGRTGVNAFSLGIEMLTTKKDKLTEAQYSALNQLIVYLKGKYPISNILGHSQIAPGRKDDPWNFDWKKVKK